MAKEEVDPRLKRWITAHLPKEKEPPPEKADQSFTIYVSKSEADRIEEIRSKFGTTRQDVLRQLVQAGLGQFARETGWWK